jgi:pimeloyl-ACP methyl ester carboxylesterase
MNLDDRIRDAETRLFVSSGLELDESFVDLTAAGVCLRVLSIGAGPSVVMLHGVSLAAAVWAPWLVHLLGYRIHLVELPGHGLSGPIHYRVGAVRDHTLGLMDELFDALGLATAPVVGHSLGGMFALWYAAARSQRIASLVAIGEPAVALPGVRVRMPLSLLTARCSEGQSFAAPRRKRCIEGCSAQGSALPPRMHQTTSSTCFVLLPAGRETPAQSRPSCMQSMAFAVHGLTAS